MDFDKVLSDLHAELQNLDVAIESLERLQSGNSARRRGRPPSEQPPAKVRKPVPEGGSKKQ